MSEPRWHNGDGTTSPIVKATADATVPKPTFAALLTDPTQQLDPEGVVLTSVLSEQERDRLRAEGWQACVDHIWRVWHGTLYGEDAYWVGRRNPFAAAQQVSER